MNIFVIFTVVMISYMYSDIKTYLIVHFKYVQFIVYQLYFNKVVF